MNIFGAIPSSNPSDAAKASPITAHSATQIKALRLIPSLVVTTAILVPVFAFMQLCATAGTRRYDEQQTYAEQAGESGQRQPYELSGDGQALPADDGEIGAAAYGRMGRTISHPVFFARAY